MLNYKIIIDLVLAMKKLHGPVEISPIDKPRPSDLLE